MSTHDNTGIGGVILFNADGTATYFAKVDGNAVATLKGTADPTGGAFANGDDTLVLTPATGAKNLKGRGRALIGGTEYPVVAYANGDKDANGIVIPNENMKLGIRPDKPQPGRAPCPW